MALLFAGCAFFCAVLPVRGSGYVGVAFGWVACVCALLGA